jgi:ribose transport system substrate-binding protein
VQLHLFLLNIAPIYILALQQKTGEHNNYSPPAVKFNIFITKPTYYLIRSGKTMKRNLVFILCLVLMNIGLVYPQSDNTKSNVKSITIGLIGKSQSNPVFVAAYAGARVAAKEIGAKYGVEVIIDWRSPKAENPHEQAQTVEQLSESGIAGIAVACSDADILTPSINKAIEKGTQVVCFDADAPMSKRLAYYGTDDIELGRMLMKELAQVMNEKGVIAVLGGNKSAPNLQRRIQSVVEELKKYPSMELLPNGIFYQNENPEHAAAAVARAQKANPQIEGWIFVGGWPLWMTDAIKWKPGKIKIVACDALPAELEYVKSGHAQVLVAQSCFLWGYKSVELLLSRIIANQLPNNQIIFDTPTRVTKENLENWSLNWKKWLIKEAVNR